MKETNSTLPFLPSGEPPANIDPDRLIENALVLFIPVQMHASTQTRERIMNLLAGRMGLKMKIYLTTQTNV